mmetsp:Transcript_29684/g.75434  ORF Transcript_29684/g.75434 Transcript_29684/m.75434 type:complete len:288 (-) Transcript_29684:110-973(-)
MAFLRLSVVTAGSRSLSRPKRPMRKVVVPSGSPIMKGTPAAIWVPAAMNLPTTPESSVCTTTTPGDWKPGAATETRPFSSHMYSRTRPPSSHAASCAFWKPKSLVSSMTSRNWARASVGIVAWYMKPPASYASMSSSHFLKSTTKEVPLLARVASTPRLPSITSPAHDGPVHPFCGAEMRTSTPSACMSVHTVPEAMQSSTKRPPSLATAALARWMYSSGSRMPVEVSTCGAKSTAGFSLAIIASSSSIGHGAYCAWMPGPCGCALTMMCSDGMSHVSKMCVHRYEK